MLIDVAVKEYLVEIERNIIYGAVIKNDGCPCAGGRLSPALSASELFFAYMMNLTLLMRIDFGTLSAFIHYGNTV